MDIRDWLTEIDLPQYADLFELNRVEPGAMADVTDAQLQALGVRALGDRILILRAARDGTAGAQWPPGLAPDTLPTYLALPMGEYLSEPNPRVRLHWLLDTVEVALRWAAAIALAEVRHANDGALPEAVQKVLRDHIERPTVGRWVGMLRELSQRRPAAPVLAPKIFDLYEAEIAPRFKSHGDDEEEGDPSILALRNRVAHGGGLSTRRSSELLREHEPGFLDLMRAVAAATAEVSVCAQVQGVAAELVGLEPKPSTIEGLPDGASLTDGASALSLAPLAAWGPIQVMGRDGRLAQRGEGMAPQIYARANPRSLSYTPLGRDEAHAESDAIASFRELFGLADRKAKTKAKKGIDFRDALREAREVAEELVGRRAEIKTIKKWIKTRKSREAGETPQHARIGWIAAGPGVGKSIVVACVARDLGNSSHNGLYYHRFETGDARNSQRAFLQLLRQALWAWEPLKAFTREPDPHVGDEEDLKEDVLARLKAVEGVPAKNPRAPAPTFRVILDGVDALPDPELPGIIREFAVPGTIWVLSGRPDKTPDFTGPGCDAIFADGMPPMSPGDIRSMLVEGLGNARYELLKRDEDEGDEVHNVFVERVVERANGLPLYVRLLLDDLRAGLLSVSDEDRLPDGLSAYYAELTSRMGIGDVQVDLTVLVCLLARSEEPLDEAAIGHLLDANEPGDDDHIEAVLAAASALLREAPTPSGARGWALYHNGFREFVGETGSLRRTRRRAERLLGAAADDWAELPPGDFRDHLFRWGTEYAMWWGGEVGRTRARARLTDFTYLEARVASLSAYENMDLAEEYDRLLTALGGEEGDPEFYAWRRFFREQVHLLRRGDGRWGAERILLQTAIEYADESPVTIAAEAWMAAGGASDRLWLRRTGRRVQVPPTACLAVFEGHRSKVEGALRTEDGRILSWSKDGTLRTWGDDGDDLVTLRGHSNRVWGVEMIGSDRALSWSEDKTLRIWDIDDGSEIKVLRDHKGVVLGAAIMPDGDQTSARRALSWSKDKSLLIWDLETGRSTGPYKTGRSYPRVGLPLGGERFACYDTKTIQIWDAAKTAKAQAILKGHAADILGLRRLPDGRLLSWSKDKTLRTWDLESGATVALEGHEDAVTGAMVVDDDRAISWSKDGTLRAWGLSAGAQLQVFSGHTKPVAGATLLADGRLLSWSDDLTLRTWDAETGEALVVSEEHMGDVSGAIELPDGRVISRSSHGALQAWDMGTGGRLAILRGHSTVTEGLMALPVAEGDPGLLLSWSQDKTLRTWTTDPALFERIAAVDALVDTSIFHQGYVAGSRRIATGPATGQVLSWSSDETLRLWGDDRPAGAGQVVLRGHAASVEGARIRDDGQVAVSWDKTFTIRAWDLGSGEAISEMSGHGRGIKGARFLSGERLLSWSSDGTIRVWALRTGEQTKSLEGHAANKVIQGVQILFDEKLLSWSSDFTLRTWDLLSGEPISVFSGHKKLVSGAVVMRGGRVLSWSSDSTVRVWDLETGELQTTLAGHNPKKAVKGTTFLPNGQLLSWSNDTTMRSWDLETGAEVNVFNGHRGDVSFAKPLGDDRILSLGRDDTVRLWDVDTGACLERISTGDAPDAWPARWRHLYARPPRIVGAGDGAAVADPHLGGARLMLPDRNVYWHGPRGLWRVDELSPDGELLALDTKGLYFLRLYRGTERVTLAGVGVQEATPE